MKNGIFISIVALSLAAITASDVQADQPQAALCNTIGANDVGTVQQIVKQGDVSQCGEFIAVFVEFAEAGCFGLIATGEIDGIFDTATVQPAGPDEGAAKNLGITVCDAVNDCGLCPAALAMGVCAMLCLP
jgi:hypothetical protein